MVYTQVSLNPTQGQMMDLADGQEVKLSHHHIAGDVEFHLTTAQMRKLSKAHASGKGATLKFSQAQLKHHFQHGSGIFHDILSKVMGYVKPLARKAAGAAIDYGANKLKDFAGIERGTGFFGDLGRTLGHGAVDSLVGLTGLGVGMKKAPRKPQRGRGFMGDALKWAGHQGVNAIAGALGGSVNPNPLANNNEKIAAALYSKKTVPDLSGRGLW